MLSLDRNKQPVSLCALTALDSSYISSNFCQSSIQRKMDCQVPYFGLSKANSLNMRASAASNTKSIANSKCLRRKKQFAVHENRHSVSCSFRRPGGLDWAQTKNGILKKVMQWVATKLSRAKNK